MGNITLPKFPEEEIPTFDILHPQGVLLGGIDLGSAGADINAWANGSHILSPSLIQAPNPSLEDQAPTGPSSLTGAWMPLPRPEGLESGEHGSGYYTYGTDDTGRAGTAANAQWGPSRTMEVIGAVADGLAIGDSYTPLGVGNISLQSGGHFKGHVSHGDGLGIDVRPVRTDGAQLPINYQDRLYDRDATQRLIDAFRATGQVDKIYFNDPQVRGVQPWKGHDNHLHVQLKR